MACFGAVSFHDGKGSCARALLEMQAITANERDGEEVQSVCGFHGCV